MAVDINDTPNRVRYTATAAQTAFSVPFQFLAAADLKIYQNGTLKTLSTHYTVTGAGASSGTVTLVSGAAVSDDILIIRDLPIERIGDFPISGPFDVESLNRQLDAITMMAQDLETRVDRRTLRLSQTDSPETVSNLPAKASRVGKLLVFDAEGQPTASASTPAIDAATAAAAASAATATSQATTATTQAALAATARSAAETARDAAGVSATNAANSASASAASATNSQASATASAASATVAAGSATTAVAAAQSSGNIVFYDTKALANAGLAGLSANQVIEVFNDESLSGQRTRYRKESGVYVFKMYLPKGTDVYIDSIGGNDANDGLSYATPKKTIQSAETLFQTSSTIWLARGSQWFGGLGPSSNATHAFNFQKADCKVRSYGQGNKPILDGAFAVTGTWVQDATYTNLWYLDVTFAIATTGASSNFSSCWHPMLWDEATTSRTVESGMIRALNGDKINGTTVSQTSIAGFLALANTAPGSFYVHRTGSTNYEPRGDNGTTFRFYIYPSDATNPNTNGRTIYAVSPYSVAIFGSGVSVEGIVMQRVGTKDMISVPGGSIKVQQFVDCDLLEAAVHATVVGGAEFRRCVAKAASHGDSATQGGGAYHNFRDNTGAGTSRGFKIFDCEAWGFTNGIFSHGDGGAGPEHETFDVDGFLAVSCSSIVAAGTVRKSIRARRITGINCGSIGAPYGSIYEDSVFINLTNHLTATYALKDTITLRNCFVYKASGKLEMCDAYNLGTVSAGDYPTVILENSTIWADVSNPNNAERCQQNWVLKNSILHRYATGGNTGWLLGTITANNSYIGLDGCDLAQFRTVHTGVDASCVSNRYKNKFQKTIIASDLSFLNTSRSATYSGTPNVDGSADLTMNFNDQVYGRYIRCVDAYGAGLHYEGRVIDSGATSSSPVVVTPAPTAAFSSKAFHNSYFNRKIWDDAFSDTASVSFDGLQLRVADPTLYTVGMLIWVGKIGKLKSDNGPRTITAITGNVLTLNAACPWATFGNVDTIFNTITNSVTSRQPLPTTTISYGFSVCNVTQVSQTSLPYPLITLNAVEGTSGTAKIADSTEVFGVPSGITGVSYTFSGRRSNGSTYIYGSIFGREGYVDVGWPLAIGDTLTVEAVAQVDDWEPKLLSNPVLSLDGSLAWNSYLANLGMGYAKRTLRGA